MSDNVLLPSSTTTTATEAGVATTTTAGIISDGAATLVRPSSIATSASVSISDRMSGISAGSSSPALSSARNSLATGTTPTTTISTIAVQSGQTKIVIALLQSREWLQLKVLNMEPYITVLGVSLKEAAEMLTSHEEVLRKLQSKQSPVEELLRQADQLISTQKPRAEVYAAMAESLGLAWKDLNTQLELRKNILKLNFSLHTQLEECSAKIIQVENVSFENPETIEACQEIISRSKILRKSMLSSFLRCLEEGQTLMDKLEEQKTIDSRPGYGTIEADYSISQVQRWLEKLHDRRGILEERFRTKHEKLNEQLLYLEIQAQLTKLNQSVEENNIFKLDYGSDVPAVKLLENNLNSSVNKITENREKAIQLAKTLDKTRFRHFQGSKLKSQVFELIDTCNQAINHAEEMRYKLGLCLEFFQLAQEANDKLDTLGTQEPERIKKLNEITGPALTKGKSLLDGIGWDNANAKGVRTAYENLRSRKEEVVKAEDTIYKTAILNDFLQSFNKLYSYLIDVDSFLKSEQNLGPELSMAEELRDTLRTKLMEVESKQMVYDLDEDVKSDDLEEKVSSLNTFMKDLLENIERRLGLTEYYIEVLNHSETVNHSISTIEEDIAERKDHARLLQAPEVPAEVKDQLAKLEQLSNGFKDAANQAARVDSAFGTKEACLKIKEILEDFHRRLDRAALVKKQAREKMNRQFSQASERLEELITSSYPILPDIGAVTLGTPSKGNAVTVVGDSPPTSSSAVPGSIRLSSWDLRRSSGSIERQYRCDADAIVTLIESTLTQVLTQVGQLECEFDSLLEQEEENEGVKSERDKLETFTTSYKLLSLNFTTFFKNLHEVDVLIEEETRNPMETENAAYEEVDEIFKICKDHADQIVMNVREIEPEDSGKIDEARLYAAIEEKRQEWDEAMRRKAKAIAARDLQQIEKQLGDLKRHLELTRGQYGDSLVAARECSASFSAFEETIDILGGKIEKFIENVDEDMRGKAAALKENWTSFLQMTKERRRLIDLSLQYFTLVDEAETWFKDGSKLLITIARKSASVKSPEEAEELLTQLESFVKPGEVKQDERIAKISQLASQLYGEEKRKLYDAMMMKENREMLDSLSSMNNELSALASNLRKKHLPVLVIEEPTLKKDEPPPAVVETISAGTQSEPLAQEVPPPPALLPAPVSAEPISTDTKTVVTETVVSQLTVTEMSKLRPLTPSMLEKETQFEEMPSDEKEKRKQERDTAAQTVEEKLYEKETQTDIMEVKPVLMPPAFTAPLQDIAINEGEKIRFHCIVTGSPEPMISWLKDGLLITSSNPDYKTEFKNGICTLTIDETFVDDSSIFTCRAANEAGTAETSAKLVVKESLDRTLIPPKFELPLPQTTTLIEGTANHQLSCLVKGNPLPTVEWFKNDVNIDTSSEFIITFNNGLCILKFDEVMLEDAGVYTCKAINKAGEAETKCELLVEARSITFLESLSKKMMARTGHKLKLECRTNTPCAFQWFHEGKEVKNNIKSDETSSVLFINEAFAKDAGHYVVIARNPKLGENKCSCQVIVKGRLPNETSDSEFHSDMEPVKPKVKMGLQDTEVREGEKVRLDCVIAGQPEPEVIWYHDDLPVKEGPDFQLIFRGDKCSLIIKEALAEDSGVYRVTAINSVGETNSSARLTVKGEEEKKKMTTPKEARVAPKFGKLIEDVMVNEDDEIVLQCSIVEGNPPPKVKWYKNSVEITDKPGYVISTAGEEHELKVVRALPEHRGNYMVKASNEAGETKCFACVIVKGPLESPSAIRKHEETTLASVEQNIIETTVHSSVVKHQMSLKSESLESSGSADRGEQTSVQDIAAFFKSKDSSTVTGPPLIIQPRANTAPRFVSPLTGVMADEGTLVVLEAQIDGHPAPTIKWTKNDLDFDYEPLSKFAHGKVTLELRNVQISDGGRYACVAENEAGIANSVADVVVKKKTFPPVFGKRLQAQTMKRNKRIYMEVEVIGTPAPTITWFKDGVPLDVRNPEYQFKAEGNRHILIVPNASPDKSGMYMVKASNEAGNAQSIADVVVLDDRKRTQGGGVTIFESTVGISDELGAPKPVTLIYETRSPSSPTPDKCPRPAVSPTPKNIPIILKTQPTLPSNESFENGNAYSFSRPVLESPRLVSPIGKPLQAVAVKVESITVTSEPVKDVTSSCTKTTKEVSSSSSGKVVQEITSHYEEKSTSIFKSVSAPTTPLTSTATSDVIEVKIPIQITQDAIRKAEEAKLDSKAMSQAKLSETKTTSAFSANSSKFETTTAGKVADIITLSSPPPPPPPPHSTPEPPNKRIPGPETILKFMETIPPSTPQSEVAAKVLDFVDRSSAGDVLSLPKFTKKKTKTSPASNISGAMPMFYETSTTSSSTEMSISESQTTTLFPILIPEPPPEICYTPKPEDISKKSHVSEKVKRFEEDTRRMSNPDIPGAVRILPPEPSPPTNDKQETPTFYRKSVPPTPPPKPRSVSHTPEPPTLPEPFPQLEPFPFKPDDSSAKSKSKPPPPPKPKKFIPGEFRESDYESDFEGKIPPKWQPPPSPIPSAFATVTSQVAQPRTVTTTTSAFVPMETTPTTGQKPVPPPLSPRLRSVFGTTVNVPPSPTIVPPTPPAVPLQPPQQEEMQVPELPPKDSVKKLVKSWPPAETQVETQQTVTQESTSAGTTTTTAEETEEIKRRSVKDDVNFFESQSHSRLSTIVATETLTPSTAGVAMDKIWSRPTTVKSKIWPPSTTALGATSSGPSASPSPSITPTVTPVPPPSSTTSEPINYYISTVSTPRTTPINFLDDYHGTAGETITTTMSMESSSSYQYEQTLQVTDESGQQIDLRTPSPTVITDRGVKPSDAKKGWPPFSASNVAPFKQLQPSWMKPASAKEQKQLASIGVAQKVEAFDMKPGSPPQIDFAPHPPTATTTSSSQFSSQSVSQSSSSYESSKTFQEGSGGGGGPFEVKHTGTIYHIMQDLELDPPQRQPSRELQQSKTHQMRLYSGSSTTNKSITEESGVSSQFESSSQHAASMSMVPVVTKRIPRYVPSKFVPGDFSESDYASDMEDVRIKPKWTPGAAGFTAESDTDSEPIYRPVRPQFKWNEKASRAASVALESLGQSFSQKAGSVAEKFSHDFVVNPPAYRQEQRNIETGESQDPGLIYFKYDFGYEFGVVMPKETTEDSRGSSTRGDVSLPIIHESTVQK